MPVKDRQIRLECSLPEDQLLFYRALGHEELGRLFQFRVELLSPDHALKLKDLLGSRMTLAAQLNDGDRFFNGVVAQIGQSGAIGGYARYFCTLRPWLWLLTRTSDSRIYRNLSVPELVRKIASQFGFGEVELKLQSDYLPREYMVQYRESYFDFISRLLEEEGIYYYFRHEQSDHVMVLCDDRGSHEAVPQYEEIEFRPDSPANRRYEQLVSWRLDQELSTGSYSVNDFDFEAPRADLVARREHALPHLHADLEQYDPLAGFVDAVDAGNGGDSHRGERGEHYARVRLEEQQAGFERIWTEGAVRGPHAGALFKLTDHSRDDQNREYLVVRAEYDLTEPGYDTATASLSAAPGDAVAPQFMARFLVQDSDHPFRPARITPRPQIPGPHTAIVVGDGEIWTDSHGRVKVHFPWDREETEGCWVRVAQVWAGSGWGGFHVPRVGQEVLVEFIEGDPDRPIITGRVYNGSNPPPFGLPDGATQSGLLSRSTTDGTKENANEIRFQDKKGEEMLFFHAEKDQTLEVENDEAHSVGHDRKKSIGNDETVEVKRNRTETVGADEKITISGNRTEAVAKDESVTVSGQRTVSVTKDDSLSVDASRSKTIAKDETTTVQGSRTETVNKDEDITIQGKRTENVAKDESVEIGQSRSHRVGKNDDLDVGKKLVIRAGDEVTIEAGSAKIVLKKDGTVQIQGVNISVKGSGTVAIKGSTVSQN